MIAMMRIMRNEIRDIQRKMITVVEGSAAMVEDELQNYVSAKELYRYIRDNEKRLARLQGMYDKQWFHTRQFMGRHHDLLAMMKMAAVCQEKVTIAGPLVHGQQLADIKVEVGDSKEMRSEIEQKIMANIAANKAARKAGQKPKSIPIVGSNGQISSKNMSEAVHADEGDGISLMS